MLSVPRLSCALGPAKNSQWTHRSQSSVLTPSAVHYVSVRVPNAALTTARLVFCDVLCSAGRQRLGSENLMGFLIGGLTRVILYWMPFAPLNRREPRDGARADPPADGELSTASFSDVSKYVVRSKSDPANRQLLCPAPIGWGHYTSMAVVCLPVCPPVCPGRKSRMGGHMYFFLLNVLFWINTRYFSRI